MEKLPLEIKIQSLRMKIKSSNRETMEEFHKLRSDIQKLYLDISRLNHRVLKKRPANQKSRNPRHTAGSFSMEIIPPDLDVNEYLNDKKNIKKAGAETKLSLPEPVSPKDIQNQPTPAHINSLIESNPKPEQRNRTIDERFTIIADRMQARKKECQEEQQKKQPWWKIW